MAIWLPNLDGRRGPKYLQVVEALAEDIASKRLKVGTLLLPHRELAFRIGMSANTISRAYAEGIKRALLRGEVGRGTFVRSPDAVFQEDERTSLRRERTGPIDLSRNLPMPGFSEPHIRRVFREIASSEGLPALLDYQIDGDLMHHNDASMIWLNSCGIDTRHDQIITTMGEQHGLLCTFMALLRTGDLLLTEALTYSPVLAMANRLGLHTATVDMDEGGVIPDSFAEHCARSKPKAFYLTPTLQSPTTVTLSENRRRLIAEIAKQNDVLLIEDDAFGPLKSDRPTPLATLAPDHTIYVTSLSKTVAPGLRVGFLRAPETMVPALHKAINLSVWMTPPITLEVAARLICDGTVKKLATQQREMASHRQSLARTLLGHTNFISDPDGFHLWMDLPADWSSAMFRAQCSRRGVLVSEARSFTNVTSDVPEAIRICLSNEADEIRLKQGLEIVSSLLLCDPNMPALEI